jgi:lysyl-tRNA synthetase class 2
MESDDKDDWLNVLLTEIIEPELGKTVPTFIYDYPASQAALAKIDTKKDGVAIAQRFELYVNGIELANGYFELTDEQEQQQRFQQDQIKRQFLQRPEVEIDVCLQAALQQGLPSCAGVAVGLDRLVMLALSETNISKVIAFASAVE